MTDKEAIEALKLINLTRVHPFYSWEEMLEVRNLAISALQARVTFCKRAPAGPITNADHIRAMSDVDLSEFLMDVTMGKLLDDGVLNVMDWLEQPYGGDTHV